jgi:uncharacterized protein YcnI
MKARLSACAVVAFAALGFAGIAQAHVAIHPNALPAGGFTVVNVNVPNEDAKAGTTRVEIQFPLGIYYASTAVLPGWKARIITAKLAKPVQIEEGFSVTTRVDRIVFSGGRIAPGQFALFPVSILVPTAKAGTLLTFKALQTYSNGKVVRWIGGDEPAPQVVVIGKNEPVKDYPAGVGAAKKTAHGAVFALPLGLLGLAGVGILRRRRKAG